MPSEWMDAETNFKKFEQEFYLKRLAETVTKLMVDGFESSPVLEEYFGIDSNMVGAIAINTVRETLPKLLDEAQLKLLNEWEPPETPEQVTVADTLVAMAFYLGFMNAMRAIVVATEEVHGTD